MTSDEHLGVLASQVELALAPVYGPHLRVHDLVALSGGASRQTLRFDGELPDGSVVELILRRDFPGRPGLPGSMGLEARALQAAGAAGLAVPSVVRSCDEPDCWGTAGLVMNRVAGETIARRILRDDRFAGARSVLASQMGHFLAGLHRIDPASVEGLMAVDALEACRETYDMLGMSSPTFEYAFRWLATHRPIETQTPTIVHGDFRLGNIIVDDAGLAAVLDWENVHLGNPVEDLGWLCVKSWRFGAAPPVAGVGSYQSLLDAYAAAGGRTVGLDELRWWELFGTLRWGVICMNQASFHLSGALPSVELAAIGRRVCEQEWDLLCLLAPGAAARPPTTPPAPLRPPPDDLHGEPELVALVEAVRNFLRDDVLASLEGRTQFLTRVAVNVLGMVEREATLGPEQAVRHARRLRDIGALSNADLALQVREGRFDSRDDELTTLLAASVRDRLAVANPHFLAEWDPQGRESTASVGEP